MKKLILMMCVAAAGTMLQGCSDDNGGKINGIIDVPTTDNITLSRAEQDANDGLNKFAFDLLNAVSKTESAPVDGNIAVSPLSASLTLAMLANSVDDDLAANISAALGCNDVATLNATCNKLLRFLPNGKGGCELALANSVWFDQSHSLAESYLNTINQSFYAEVNSFDANDRESISLIDKWCAAKTNGRINSIMDMLDGSDIVLLNAMYFDGKWSAPFEKSETKRKDFHGTAGTTSVQMMHSVRDGVFYELNNATAVAIAFKGNNEMIFMLPDEGTTTDELSKNISASDWNNKEANPCDIKLELPRYTVESTLQLNEALSALGLGESTKSLSKMGITSPAGISTVQKNMTSVDEEGATAASVTGSGMVTSPGPSDVRTFTLDRPFLYLLRNTVTGSILLAGRVNNLPNAN